MRQIDTLKLIHRKKQSNFGVRRERDARLTFAGGALTLPLTKGMLHAPLEPQ
jgi:hypothetical protein